MSKIQEFGIQDSHKNELLEEIKEMTTELKKRSTKISDLEEQLEILKSAQAELALLKGHHQKSEGICKMLTPRCLLHLWDRFTLRLI